MIFRNGKKGELFGKLFWPVLQVVGHKEDNHKNNSFNFLLKHFIFVTIIIFMLINNHTYNLSHILQIYLTFLKIELSNELKTTHGH